VTAQSYVTELARSGSVDAARADVRRGKALAVLMQCITVLDTDGNTVTLDDLRDRQGDENNRRIDPTGGPARIWPAP
jgi:trigger factor